MGRKNNETNGGGDPSKLPAHLRNMMGSGTPAAPSQTSVAPGAPAGSTAAPEPFNWGLFLRNWWFILIVMPLILVVRFYVWSPFKIPSGSMEPELLGNEDNGDRVVVDLTAYHKADPARWDIAVFKCPELKADFKTRNDTKNVDYVKRVVGVAGDRIIISGGDLYNISTGTDGREKFELLRKPDDLQRTLWHTLYNFPYDLPWETPEPLFKHGEWELQPEGIATVAPDLKSFHLAAPAGTAWTLQLRRTATPMLMAATAAPATPAATPATVPATTPPVTPAPVVTPPAGPVMGPVMGPVAPGAPAPQPAADPAPASPASPTAPAAPVPAVPAVPQVPQVPPADSGAPAAPAAPGAPPAPNGPYAMVSILSNRYLKPGDYWFRIPGTNLAPWRSHVRGSQTALLVPDDIQPVAGVKPGVIDPEAKQWKSKRLFPIPLEWYAGSAEIETKPAQSVLDWEAELWQLPTTDRAAYANRLDAAARKLVAESKGARYKGTSLRVGQAYGGQFGSNDLRIELALDVKDWGKRFDLTVDEELSTDGTQILRRYGLRVEQGQGLPWVEEFDADTKAFKAVTPDGATATPLPVGSGMQRLMLEHVDGAIRLVMLDIKTGTEGAATGFRYNRPPRAMKQFAADLRLSGEGSDVTFQKIQISRDLYYLWDEFKLMADNGIAANIRYRTDNRDWQVAMPDGFLVHRADGLTEFALKPAATPGDRDSWFLMCGDNTVSSVDGRNFGPVERWRFSGKYWFTAWPPSRAGAAR